jgi:hypothetical protein
MSEAVTKLLRGYQNLSDDEQAEFLDQIEEVDPLIAITNEPGFDEFLAERLAEAEDPSKLLTMDEVYASALKKFRKKS